nr:immunoglobulin light chain junction region [Macaca mulatta]
DYYCQVYDSTVNNWVF